MPQFLKPLLDVAQSTINSGCLVAFAAVCLLQYATNLVRRKRIQYEMDRFRREAESLESELKCVNRDQTVTKLENQILRDILSQTDFTKALDQLLRRLVPNPSDNFSVFIELGQEQMLPRQSRGLSEESSRLLRLDDSLVELLRVQKSLTLEHLALQRSRVFACLAPADRKKARQVFIIGVSEGSDLFGALVTTSLLPMNAPREQQFELTSRLMASITGNLRQTLMLEKQSNQLRCTREMLELRSITDARFDQPVQMLEKFVLRLAQMLSAERGSLYLNSRESAAGPKAAIRCGVQLQPGLASAWQQHEDQLANCGTTYPHAVYFDGPRLQKIQIHTLVGSALTVPLSQNGASVGLLCITRRSPMEFNSVERQLLEWAIDTLSQAMQRTLAFAAIERQARQDGLTELANRRTFDLQIQREVDEVQSGGQIECSLLLMDIDRFKSINDEYGHLAGDEVLRSTAQALRDQMSRIRAGDRALLARYGGEELAALLPGVGIAGALRIAESIRQAIESNEVHYQGQTIHATISIGVSTCPLHAKSAQQMIAAADMSLYQAKSNGRNLVCCPGESAPMLESSAASAG